MPRLWLLSASRAGSCPTAQRPARPCPAPRVQQRLGGASGPPGATARRRGTHPGRGGSRKEPPAALAQDRAGLAPGPAPPGKSSPEANRSEPAEPCPLTRMQIMQPEVAASARDTPPTLPSFPSLKRLFVCACAAALMGLPGWKPRRLCHHSSTAAGIGWGSESRRRLHPSRLLRSAAPGPARARCPEAPCAKQQPGALPPVPGVPAPRPAPPCPAHAARGPGGRGSLAACGGGAGRAVVQVKRSW